MEDDSEEKRALAETLLGDPEIVAWLDGRRTRPDDSDEDMPESER